MEMKKKDFLKKGAIDGLPIALGYFAVSFSLGIQAKKAGISAFFAMLMSLTNLTSAGEFAAISIIKESGSYIALALSQLVINLRYLLMSCALSQKFDSKASLLSKMIAAFGITDEIFGIGIGAEGKLSPYYIYGAMLVAVPGWSLGTYLGVIMGNILPVSIVNALSVSLYGMFIAIFIPPAKKDKKVAAAVIFAMLLSYLSTVLPIIKEISSGVMIIILTVTISLVFAVFFPINAENETEEKEIQ